MAYKILNKHSLIDHSNDVDKGSCLFKNIHM